MLPLDCLSLIAATAIGYHRRMNSTLRTLCVYCGSSAGHDPAYASAARSLGKLLAERGIGLVYGGGHVGLMGIIADAVLDGGGTVTGVIPEALANKEISHHRVTELHVVADMHERKAMMAERSDGFLAMPGGIGTLEELFEVMTWLQLGYHAKPVGLLNVNGFYDGLLAFLDTQRDQGFLRPEHRALLLDNSDPASLLARLQAFHMTEGVSFFSRKAASTLGP